MNPNSRLWLCKTNLENDYKNTLTFSSKNNQRNYFIGDPSDPTSHGTSTKMYSDYTYLRIENAIKVDDFIENIDTNNYAVILNNSKYYYYFITSMEYIDDTTTKIYIELDVMQTYFFDINYNNTFVEREHVVDDTPGAHTIPEGLETGDYIGNTSQSIESRGTDYIIFQVILDTTPNPSDPWESVPTRYGGVYSGTEYRIFDITNAGRYIKYMDDKGKRDYIVNIFMYNGSIEDDGNTYTIVDQGSIVCEYELVKTSSDDVLEQIQVYDSKPTTNGSYTPRNKKLLTYPYCYLLVNNMAGTSKMYKYEDFYVDDISFAKSSIVSVGGSSVYYPIGYKQGYTWGREANINEGFVGAKFPVCSWTSDAYTNWLTQKAIDDKYRTGYRVAQTIASAAALGGGLATGNPALIATGATGLTNVASSAANDVIGDMQQKEEHQIAPMELQGMSSAGDVIYATERCKPQITPMYIRREYCEIIDKFFDQYGYKVNILKTPNIHTRRYWNFLKTKNCNFTGNIPQEYMVRIKSIFDSGITFWHDPSKMFDYSQTNSVLS